MFAAGEMVVYGGEGVCRVEGVGTPSLPGMDKTRLYYTLAPLYRSGQVMTPVDTQVLMRPLLTAEETAQLIAELDQLPEEQAESHSMRAIKDLYHQVLTSYDCRRLAGLIKGGGTKALKEQGHAHAPGFTAGHVATRQQQM